MTQRTTRAERREAVERLLLADPIRSDRGIARGAGVSHTTVGAVRAELELAGRIDRRSGQPSAAKQATSGQNANLLRQTADGASLAATHGAHSPRMLAPRVEELTAELRGVVPNALPGDDTVIRLLALLLAQIEAVNAWVAEHGLFKRRGRSEPQPILTLQSRWIANASKLCDQLGLSPTARARLGAVQAGDDAYVQYRQIIEGKGS